MNSSQSLLFLNLHLINYKIKKLNLFFKPQQGNRFVCFCWIKVFKIEFSFINFIVLDWCKCQLPKWSNRVYWREVVWKIRSVRWTCFVWARTFAVSIRVRVHQHRLVARLWMKMMLIQIDRVAGDALVKTNHFISVRIDSFVWLADKHFAEIVAFWNRSVRLIATTANVTIVVVVVICAVYRTSGKRFFSSERLKKRGILELVREKENEKEDDDEKGAILRINFCLTVARVAFDASIGRFSDRIRRRSRHVLV